jgi:predicted choloylglycine hydrolase
MRKSTNLSIAIGAGLCFGATAQADDLRFTTLPPTVQTTVIREMRIPNASSVTRIVRDSSGNYVVTVRGATGEQVIYVNEAGLIVQAPVTNTTVQKSAGTVLPAFESSQTVVTYDQVQQNVSRYQLLEKKGTKEVYRDNRTGQKVTVELDNN